MRMTITIADDVYAAMERLGRDEGLSPSEALNRLARRGLAGGARADFVFTPHAFDLGAALDYTDIGEVEGVLDAG
ncbi:MAG: hypothetical protein Q4F65_06615 [Propionibacteriaceae bacterium]|nr:hypothetical protein [Propionibacteriaceae bacterium]